MPDQKLRTVVRPRSFLILTLLLAVGMCSLYASAIPVSAAPAVDLGSIGGPNGYSISGESPGDEIGKTLNSAGDVNGDGLDDFIIGSAFSDANGRQDSGSSYVIFGRIGTLDHLSLSDLDGTNGFRIRGVASGDLSGMAVSGAGDVNGDGLHDLLVGAPGASGNGLDRAGAAHIIFGAPAFSDELSLATLNGINGVRLNGASENDRTGSSVSAAGDLNGDGLGDVIVGAPDARVGSKIEAGKAYVVFGRKVFTPTLDLGALDGSDGFQLNGNTAESFAGNAVSGLGDINRDGYDDAAVGAWRWGSGAATNSGAVFVLYGKDTFPAVIGLGGLKDATGLRIDGVDNGDGAGASISDAGDVNRDGYADLMIGAPLAFDRSGASYLVLGGPALPNVLKLSNLNGQNGIEIRGTADFIESGLSVSGSGDINGDGYGEVMVGAPGEGVGSLRFAGRAHIILGKANLTTPVLLNPGAGGPALTYEGTNGGVQAGQAVSAAGDTNGDGFDDFLVSAPRTGEMDTRNAGSVYLILGGETLDLTLPVTHAGSQGNDNLSGSAGEDFMNGGRGDDMVSGLAATDVVIGAAGQDLLNGGPGGDFLAGKNGFDSATYATSAAGVNVNLLLGIGTGGDAAGDILTSIEGIVGSSKSDTLTGDNLDNHLEGLGDNDVLAGKGGDDLYFFSPNSGQDTIVDFVPGPQSEDVLVLRQFAGIEDKDDLTIEPAGPDARVLLPGGGWILLKGVSAAQLHDDDFWIGTSARANDDYFDTPLGQTLNVPAPGVLSNDQNIGGGPVTAVLHTGPAHGQLSLQSNGSLTYVPDAGFIGADSFTYMADNGSVSNTAVVTIDVTLVAPTAVKDSYSTLIDVPLVVAAPGVLANDQSPAGLPLSAELTQEPINGSLTFSPNGSFKYTPETNYAVHDSFKYRATNGLFSPEVEVSIEVRIPGQEPDFALYLPSVMGSQASGRSR